MTTGLTGKENRMEEKSDNSLKYGLEATLLRLKKE
jgi:hypothetical protein